MTETPTLFLPYQSTTVAEAENNDILVIEKSRRIGITYGISPWAALCAAAEKSSSDVYYIGYNLDMAREFIGYAADFSKTFDNFRVSLPDEEVPLQLMHKDKYGHFDNATGNISISEGGEFLLHSAGQGIKTFRIDYPSGKSIVALPSTPRSVRGKQGIFIIDEAAFHDNLELLIDAIIATLIWGGAVIVVSTHFGADNYFNELIDLIRSGKREGKVLRITFKDAIKQGFYKRICFVQGKEWTQEKEHLWEARIRKSYGEAAAQELDVIPAMGSGTYLSRATIFAATSNDLPVIRLTCPDGFERNAKIYREDYIREFLEEELLPYIRDFDGLRHSFFGQDFARSGDVSPLAFGQRNELGCLIAKFIIEMRNVPFADQEYILNWIIERVPLFSSGKMDARGNGSALAEAMQMRWGFDRIEAVQSSDKTYLDFMPKLKAAIEDLMLIIPNDEPTIDDLRMVKLVNGIPKIPDRGKISKTDGSGGKRHGDNAIALMHFVAAADEDVAPLEFRSTGARAGHIGGNTKSSRGFGTVGARANTTGY